MLPDNQRRIQDLEERVAALEELVPEMEDQESVVDWLNNMVWWFAIGVLGALAIAAAFYFVAFLQIG